LVEEQFNKRFNQGPRPFPSNRNVVSHCDVL